MCASGVANVNVSNACSLTLWQHAVVDADETQMPRLQTGLYDCLTKTFQNTEAELCGPGKHFKMMNSDSQYCF